MEKPLSYEEISEIYEELCKYCRCTDYGFEMKAKNAIMGITYGCEGMFCDEAYKIYVEDFEE